jgi:hypothetical protein
VAAATTAVITTAVVVPSISLVLARVSGSQAMVVEVLDDNTPLAGWDQ